MRYLISFLILFNGFGLGTAEAANLPAGSEATGAFAVGNPALLISLVDNFSTSGVITQSGAVTFTKYQLSSAFSLGLAGTCDCAFLSCLCKNGFGKTLGSCRADQSRQLCASRHILALFGHSDPSVCFNTEIVNVNTTPDNVLLTFTIPTTDVRNSYQANAFLEVVGIGDNDGDGITVAPPGPRILSLNASEDLAGTNARRLLGAGTTPITVTGLTGANSLSQESVGPLTNPVVPTDAFRSLNVTVIFTVSPNDVVQVRGRGWIEEDGVPAVPLCDIPLLPNTNQNVPVELQTFTIE